MQLLEIQKLQFSEKQRAELELLRFLQENEDTEITKVELTPRPESLNSINGFITYSNNERVFFKTHVEENEQVSEYYNAKSLAEAGYPVVSAKQIQHRPGKQIALYEILTYPTLFDKLKESEDIILKNSQGNESGAGSNSNSHPSSENNKSNKTETYLDGQIELEKQVFSIYEKSLELTAQSKQSSAPINQLFAHRLRADGRLGLFYKSKAITLKERSINFEQLADCTWTINGVSYEDTLAKIIERSVQLLTPENAPEEMTATVVGHGDAHNGNIFLVGQNHELKMFDPAFAGRHNALLDLTKPLFHNIFARWMYFPEQVAGEITLNAEIENKRITIEHDFCPSSLRLQHLSAKKAHLLQPTIGLLKSKNLLPANWKEYLHCSLFCCPFLTVNLFADYVPNGTLAERYPQSIKWLGLALAIALGSIKHTGQNKFTEIVSDIFTEPN